MHLHIKKLSTISQGGFGFEYTHFYGYNLHMATKRTYQPSKIRKARTHGFRKRMQSANGRKVLKNRITKGRKKLIP